jgi:anti-sigma regulatory factor (Ser/Thr protein kinase)
MTVDPLPSAPVVRLSVGSGCRAPSRSRAALRALVEHWRLAVDQDALALCITEVVTNAVLHGQGVCWLQVRRQPGYLRVEVADPSPRPPSHTPPAVADTPTVCGRGLALLDALTDCWGHHHTDTDKVVWFEIATEQLPTPNHPLPWETPAGRP